MVSFGLLSSTFTNPHDLKDLTRSVQLFCLVTFVCYFASLGPKARVCLPVNLVTYFGTVTPYQRRLHVLNLQQLPAVLANWDSWPRGISVSPSC